MPSASTVVIKRNDEDITNSVIAATASFESQINALPGTFEFTCRDPLQQLEFVTGDEITLDIDGKRMYGGYLTQVSRGFLVPVADTVTNGPGAVKTRSWVLRGVDYNILFDKRVLRNPDNYLTQLPYFLGDRFDGDLIRNELTQDWLDLDGLGLDTTTYVDDIMYPVDPDTGVSDPDKHLAWVQQGSTWRKQMEDFAQFSGARWYIDPDKNLHYHSIETSEARWGFSDVPNKLPVDGNPAGTFMGATYGFRDIDAVEDGTLFINDALIWGGSQFSGTSGGTVFARKENATSQSEHGRWQLSETHFGDTNYASQRLVNARADVIVNGQPGQVGGDSTRGLSHEQWKIRLTWFSHNVPVADGDRDHMTVGQMVTIALNTFGTDPETPLIQTLPLRQTRISFPAIDKTGKGYVKFEGTLALQLDDPWTLWRFLLKQKNTPIVIPPPPSTDNSSPDAPPGGEFFDSTLEHADGERRTFHIAFPYIPGSLRVYLDGALQTLGTDYVESDPDTGEFEFFDAPETGTQILATANTQGSTTNGTIVPAEDGALAAAVAAANPGDLLLLRGGDHNVDDIIYVDKSLTLQNYGDEIPVITHPTAEAEFIFFTSGPNLTKGIRFVGVTTRPDDYVHGSALISMQADSHDNRIENCEFHGASGYGATQQLIYHHDSAGNNAQIINCLIDGHGGGGFGVHLYPGPGPNNVLVQGNTIRGFPNKSGVLVWTDSSGIEILGNFISDCGSAVRHHNSLGCFVDGNVGGGGLGEGLEVDDATNLTEGDNDWGV